MKHFLFFGVLCFATSIVAQKFSKEDIVLLSYNVENLFDTIDDKHVNDNEFLPAKKKQWNTQRYQDKLKALDTAISLGGLPSMLSLVEVENLSVLQDLRKQTNVSKGNYAIVHFDSPDRRGIDCAFLYDSTRFRLLTKERVPVTIDSLGGRFRTRDILYVKVQIHKKDTLHIFVNHWPSRAGGREKSDFKRYRAAEVLRHKMDSILALVPESKIVATGDFNDEPEDVSMQYLIKEDSYVNLMSELPDTLGTYNYRGNWNMLDQFVVSKGLLNARHYKTSSSLVVLPFEYEYLFHTTRKGNRRPNKTYAGKNYLGGVSDHLWVSLTLVWK